MTKNNLPVVKIVKNEFVNMNNFNNMIRNTFNNMGKFDDINNGRKKIVLIPLVFITIVFYFLLSVAVNSNLVSASNNTVDHIIISEVLYNPNGTETGREAVELYNPTDSNINIGGWYLKTKSSNKDAILPDGEIIKAKSYILIADSGWSQSKDQDWVLADYEEAITLSNTDAGVSIINSNDTIIDSVGWGSESGISSGLFEGSSALEVKDGYSLSRVEDNNFIDTNNNSFDFYETLPNLRNSNSTSSSMSNLKINFEVVEHPLLIQNLSMTDDLNQEGFQILLNPGGNKTIIIKANISSIKAVVNCSIVGFETEAMKFDNKSSLFVADFQLPYYQSPGYYNVNITALSGNTTAHYNTSFDIEDLLALKLDSSSLNLGQIIKGKTESIEGDIDIMTPGKPTVMNIGNINSNIQVDSSGIFSSSNTFYLSNIEFSFTPDFSNFNGFLNETNNINIQLSPSDTIPLYFKIRVPQEQEKGVYSGSVMINAIG